MRSSSFFRVSLLAPVAGAAWLVATTACGPSFQAVYEGNARFEHCYALEENPQVGMPDKASCWKDWSERYTFGQTRDRVQYATARYVALAEARDAPTDEALMMAAPGQTPRASVITAPAPTNAFAPPPKVLDEGQHEQTVKGIDDLGNGKADAGAPAKTVSYPAAKCSDVCQDTFTSCGKDCDGDAGLSKTRQSCSKSYKECMRSCFK